jgi:glyoxylase-like metal-dependent hydrolase (beta-lactamase superfamily II)
MSNHKIHTIDLNFLDSHHAIAAYLIPYEHGAVLVECGPPSTLPALAAGLKSRGYDLSDVTDVLVTHIHLDHAGASGWLAKNGTRVHVHHVGAPHLADPSKLLASASRIYGEWMDNLWGEIIPVPGDLIYSLEDGDEVLIGDLQFTAIDTPGHAYHHHAYILDDVCFSGDVGGIRMPGPMHVQLPFPPPEIHLEKWRTSAERLGQLPIKAIAPTHFGIYEDVPWHLSQIKKRLDQVEVWLEEVMTALPTQENLRELFTTWSHGHARAEGLDKAWLEVVEKANPNWMSAAGLARYWRKYRVEAE